MAWLRQISPAERLSELLGGDESLVEAVLAGLRGTVWCSDIPGVEEILRLKESSRRHRLALPFLAGLEILQRETPERLGHVPQVGVTVHHPYQLLAGSLQQHLLA